MPEEPLLLNPLTEIGYDMGLRRECDETDHLAVIGPSTRIRESDRSGAALGEQYGAALDCDGAVAGDDLGDGVLTLTRRASSFALLLAL